MAEPARDAKNEKREYLNNILDKMRKMKDAGLGWGSFLSSLFIKQLAQSAL
jgi:hypothetical protein